MTENDQQRDLEKLQSYAELLEDNAPSIALALYCGATIGRTVPSGPPGQRMLEGATILSKALRFDKATMQQVRDWLADYARKFADHLNRMPLPAAQSLQIPPEDPQPWRSALKVMMEQIPVAPISPEDLDRFRNESMGHWKNRCSSYLGGKPFKAFGVLPEDLLSRASGQRFFSLLNFDLSEMTLRDWSNVVYWTSLTAVDLPKSRSGSDYCPPWLLAVALDALGLGFDQLPEREPTRLSSDERSDWDAMASLVVDRRHADRFKALIIKHPESSTVESWEMTAKNTAAVLTADEYVELRRRSVIFKEDLFGAVIFEAPVASKRVAEIMATMQWTDATGRFWYIANQRTPEKLDAPLVTTPKDLDDAVSRGLKGWQRRARTKGEEPLRDSSSPERSSGRRKSK